MSNPIRLTRNQLAKFLPNPETIKAFENLFKQATETNPINIGLLTSMTEEANSDANTGISLAHSAHDIIEENKVNVLSITSSYSVPNKNYIVICDATSGAIVVTMPLASTARFRKITVTKTDTSVNTVTILASGADLIAGSSSQILLYDRECLELVSDGTNWQIGG